MKKKFTLLLALAALGLAACGGGGESSSITSSEDSSSEEPTSSSVPSSDPSSSEVPSSSDPSSSDPSTSSEPEPEKGWTEADLAVIGEVIGDHALPYYDFSAINHTYTLEKSLDSEGGDMLVLTVNNFAFENIANVVEAWVGDGTTFIDETDQYSSIPAGMTILGGYYEDDTTLQVQFFLNDGQYYLSSGTGIFNIYVFVDGLATTDWATAVDDLNTLIDSLLSLDPIELPEPTTPADSYIALPVYDSYGSGYPQLRMAGVEDDAYLDQLVTAGWKEIDGVAAEGIRYITSPDGSIGFIGAVQNGKLLMQFEANNYFTSWPAAKIAADVALVANPSATSLPTLPEPSFLDQVTMIEIYDSYAYYGFFNFYLQGGNFVDAYIAQLLEAGFVGMRYYYGDIEYGDPNSAILVSVSYNEDYNYTAVSVSTGSEDSVIEWPTERLADVVTALGGSASTVIPAPTFAWDYASIYDYVEDYEYFEIDVQTVAEDGSLVDTTAQYAAQLTAEGSGWSYDAVQECYYNDEENIRITISYDESYGLVIYIEKYAKILDTWPSTEIAAGITETGIVTETEIIPFNDGSGYRYEVGTDDYGDAFYFVVTAYGVTAEEHTAYEASLAAAGWETSTYSYGTKVWYDAAGTISLMMVFDDTEGTLMMAFYNVKKSPLGLWDSYVSQIAAILTSNYDESFVLPVPEVPEGTLGWTDTTGYYYGTLDFYVFDLTIAAGYAAQLTEAGWVESAELATSLGADYAFSLTGSSYAWYLYIDVDETNNATHVHVGQAAG